MIAFSGVPFRFPVNGQIDEILFTGPKKDESCNYSTRKSTSRAVFWVKQFSMYTRAWLSKNFSQSTFLVMFDVPFLECQNALMGTA